MTTKFIKKPVLSVTHVVAELESYLKNETHISKVLNKLSNNDIPILITYLKSLLKFNSLTMTKNKLSEEKFQTQLIRPAQYLLLCLSFIEKNSIELNINNGILNKVSNKFSFKFSLTKTYRTEKHDVNYPDFLNYDYLLPCDYFEIKIYDTKKTMKRYVVPFLNLSFYTKDNIIQFFEDKVITEDFISKSNLDDIYNKYNYSHKKYY